MEARSLHDIYSCPHCRSIAAYGDYHCRGCGVRFSENDVEVMKSNVSSFVAALPWNTRDCYRCVHCDKFVSIRDNYCRGCGDEIEDHEKQLMRLRLSELAKQNTPALIGLGIFLILVVAFLVAIV